MDYKLRSGGGGMGMAENMSSAGICFRCDRELPPGELIEVELMWPVPLEGRGPRMLRLQGIILRSSPLNTAMAISKYDFHMPG
jgi:hypothetical protein